MGQECVVLVDEQNTVLGTIPKAAVHRRETPLHRGFSVFIFRKIDRRVLLQLRSARKKTWPLMWSNSCCGHPAPGESDLAAARRRLKYELGLEPRRLEYVAPYRYCFTRDGIMENELCPIFMGVIDSEEPVINPNEVEAVRWLSWDMFRTEVERSPHLYSEWCIEEARILELAPRCHRFARP